MTTMPDANELSIPLSVAQRLAKAGALDTLSSLVASQHCKSRESMAKEFIESVTGRIADLREEFSKGRAHTVPSVLDDLEKYVKNYPIWTD